MKDFLQAVWLGDFAKEEEAARMYDRAAICVRGSAAMLNYLREDYANGDLCSGWVACEEQLQSVLSKFKRNKGFVSRRCVLRTQVSCVAAPDFRDSDSFHLVQFKRRFVMGLLATGVAALHLGAS